MEKIVTPPRLLTGYDFTLERLCGDCPLLNDNGESGFVPGYGVSVVYGEQDTTVKVKDLSRGWRAIDHIIPVVDATQAVLPNPVRKGVPGIKTTFDECKEPITQRRRLLSDRKICGALALLLADSRSKIKTEDCLSDKNLPL